MNNTIGLARALQIQTDAVVALIAAESVKEYPASWLKNGQTVMRDGSGRFYDGGPVHSKREQKQDKSLVASANKLASSLAGNLKKLTSDQAKKVSKAASSIADSIGNGLDVAKKDFQKGAKAALSALEDTGKFLDKHKTSIALGALSIGLGVLGGYVITLAAANFAASAAAVGVLRTLGISMSLENQAVLDSMLLAFSAGASSPVGQVALGMAKLNIAAGLMGTALLTGAGSYVASQVGAAKADDEDKSLAELGKPILKEAKEALLDSKITGKDIAKLFGLKGTDQKALDQLLEAFQGAIKKLLQGKTPAAEDLKSAIEALL